MQDAQGNISYYYTIGALAQACGKNEQTIRRWIREGTIPETSLRTREIAKTLGEKGRRLWTVQQISTIAELLTKEGLAGGYVDKYHTGNWVRFKNAMWQAWHKNGWL